ncbi:hypothetical protein BDP27DRAFT_1332500 [Rhodocollybia butyracea]|uniref:Nucleotidylyl transferase n=1 Tax=Rhodocollybia butyracea TaxID=206335 RepID=A0A9P5PN74_9AGAR|nr:hypothetical protein BDP27DRAFT_1332500 [Rhodocollybia butyracea]
MASSLSSSIRSALQRLQTGSVSPPVEVLWASHPSWPLSNGIPSSVLRTIRISVLDSSFNPPTLAHSALADTPALGSSEDRSEAGAEGSEYDAKLLLLSVRNADKQLKSGDATYVQRVEMMIELAKDLQESHCSTSAGNVCSVRCPSVAVAIIDEPTFVGKSRLLQAFLREKLQNQPSPPETQLTFLLGYDTLERLFAPKYYGSSEEKMYRALRGDNHGDNSRVICARRSPSSYPHSAMPPPNTPSASSSDPISLSRTISSFLASSALPPSCVTMVDIGEDVWNVSSSEVREGVRKESEVADDPTGAGSEVKSGIEHRWRGMVTERVRKYIIEHGLYR